MLIFATAQNHLTASMYEETTFLQIFFYMLFGGVAMMSSVACGYILLRKGNAFSSDVNPPARLRNFTAVFFASIAVSHIWWWLFRFAWPGSYSPQTAILCMSFDVLVVLPALLCMLLAMLQDRRRPLWNVIVVEIIGMADLALYGITGDKYSILCVLLYTVLLLIIMLILIRALREYGRWLRQNHADLEHKEVWQTFVITGVTLATSLIYAFSSGSLLSETLIEVADIVLISTLLWRVETLQTLEEIEIIEDVSENVEPDDILYEKLDALLQEYCVNKRFYLRHNASMADLANIMGTNTSYLSQHFAQQGINYNIYINGLRIAHFEKLYKQTLNEKYGVKVTDIIGQCGFGSYSAFSKAFKDFKGQNVQEWRKSVVWRGEDNR